ncbi:MAG TPA: gliding motility-associated ABC transporter substrate-binding protein GldG [Chitinophagaceae bacterium]|nr:gliding motility-associated ABC transporter substrate-binding protein GldG [Chitinophagaceae bacterium]
MATPFIRRFWWLLLIAALVGINFLAALGHARIDLTEEKRYSLSRPTKDLLRGLDDVVYIDVYLEGDDLPAVVRKFRNGLADFLEEAREYGGTRLQYRFVNPYESGDTAQVQKLVDSLNSFGLSPVYLNAPDEVGDKLEVQQLIHGALIRYGSETAGVDLLKGIRAYGTEPEQLAQLYNDVEATIEYKFGSAIQKLTAKERPVVAYATGHGETWGPTVDDAVRTLFTEYRSDTFNLLQAPAIPQEINALVILKPTRPFSDRDKLKIDQYLMHGGKVFWMVDNMFAEFDSLYQTGGFVAFDRALNLEDLLFNFGVRLNQNLLQDMQCDKLPQVSGEGTAQQRRLVDWPFFPILNGTGHPISKNLDGVRALFPSSLDTVEAPGVKKTILLHSSNNARLLTAPARVDFEFLQIAPEAAQFRQAHVPVAVLLEGGFRSLYTGRVPRTVADSLRAMNMPFRSESDGRGKMIVVADGDIAANQFSELNGPLPMGQNLFTQYTFANKEFYSNALEYLVNPTDILQTRAKEYSLRLLDPRRTDAERGKWQAINIVLPVLLIILFGAGYQQYRKRKYRGT